MVRTAVAITLIYLLCCGTGCYSPVREPGFTHEQYVSDSSAIHQFMMDSLPEGSRYVDLGLRLIKCDSFLSGRWVEHNFQSTGEVIPPVQRMYFGFNSEGKIQHHYSKDEFFAAYYASGYTTIIIREPYK